jgi:hypothetical protein
MKPLFRDVKELSFGKTANYKLPVDNTQWITEILKRFHEDYPWAGKYLTSVNLKEENPEEGYGFGWIEITSSGGEGATTAKIPIVIKDNELYPMDMIVDAKGEYRPMSERRLDEALFTPKIFEKTVKEEDLKSQQEVGPFTLSEMYPPVRQGYMTGGATKQGSLLEAIRGTIYDEDLERVGAVLGDNETLKKLALSNKAFYSCLKVLHEAEKDGHTHKTASVDYDKEISATVLQVVRLPGTTYLVKTANPHAFYPRRQELDRATALAKLGEDTVRKVDLGGCLTVTTNTSLVKDAQEDLPKASDSSGKYQVSTPTGAPLEGIVFPAITSMTGAPVPLRLFSGGDTYAMQEEIVGKKSGDLKSDDVPTGPPRGFGVLFWDSDKGVEATEPIVVTGMQVTETGPVIEAHTMMGEKKRILPSPVEALTPSGESEVMVPAGAKFHPIKGDKPIPLADSSEMVAKSAALKSKDRRFTIQAINKNRFNFYGKCGLDKIARKHRSKLDYDDAVFLGTALGMSPEFAESKLAAAIQWDEVTITGLYPLIPIEEYEKKAEAKLAQHKDALQSYMGSLKQDLIKEAVIFEDEDTVDNVLGLNFVNPDNIKVFVEYLPQLQETQQKLIKLLVSTRLGLKELDENALRNAIEGLENTINGLKLLLHTVSEATP